MDRRARKTGYGIWLHGAGDDRRIAEEYVTEGCVIFFNKDIIRLAPISAPRKECCHDCQQSGRSESNGRSSSPTERVACLAHRVEFERFRVDTLKIHGEYQMSRPFRKARRLWGRAFPDFKRVSRWN